MFLATETFWIRETKIVLCKISFTLWLSVDCTNSDKGFTQNLVLHYSPKLNENTRNSVFTSVEHFSLQKGGNVKEQAKIGSCFKGNTKEQPRNIQSRNTSVHGITEEYWGIQVSEEIEGRVTKKLSQEFSRTESRSLGALSKLDDFLLKP